MNNGRTSRYAGLLSVALLLAACASMRVGSDQYPQADFSSYRSYAWMGEDPFIRPRDTQLDVSALTVRMIREAVESELSARGYRKLEAPAQADFVVAFTVGARDRLDTEAYPMPYRGPWLWDWPARTASVQVYREGTLSIDVFDGASRQPVWHGWARKSITSADESDPGPVIRRAVARILQQFPAPPP